MKTAEKNALTLAKMPSLKVIMLKTNEDIQVRTPHHTNLRKISQISGAISLPALDESPLNFVNQFTNLKAFYPLLLMDIRLLVVIKS